MRINAAFSVHPYVARGWKATISGEWKDIANPSLNLKKRLHFGGQIVIRKKFYLWGGLNQMLITAGAGMRVVGGDLELGTYAVDVGQGETSQSDRRLLFRYTISF